MDRRRLLSILGDKSYLHMIVTKYLRIMSVADQKNTNFESLEDTY